MFTWTSIENWTISPSANKVTQSSEWKKSDIEGLFSENARLVNESSLWKELCRNIMRKYTYSFQWSSLVCGESLLFIISHIILILFRTAWVHFLQNLVCVWKMRISDLSKGVSTRGWTAWASFDLTNRTDEVNKTTTWNFHFISIFLHSTTVFLLQKTSEWHPNESYQHFQLAL